MAESQLKANSLRVRFERGNPEPSDVEVFKFMKTKMMLKCDNLLSMYKEKQELSVIIKFKTEDDLKSTLRKLPGSMEFAYDKYQCTVVQLSPANAIVRYVRIFNLPPEVEDREIWDALSKYGKVQRLVREKYPASTGFPIWNSVRGAYIEIKENGEIPATLQIRNIRARLYYEGLVNKCFQCGATDHLKADCPNRKSVNDRLESNQGSYSGAVTGGANWSKQNAKSASSGSQGQQTMTNLNELLGKDGAKKPDEGDKEPGAGSECQSERELQKLPDQDLEKKQLVESEIAGPSEIVAKLDDAMEAEFGDENDADANNCLKPIVQEETKGAVKRVYAKGKTGDSGSSSDVSADAAEVNNGENSVPHTQASISEQQGVKTRSRSKQPKLVQDRKARSRSNPNRNRCNSETDATKSGGRRNGKLNSSQSGKYVVFLLVMIE